MKVDKHWIWATGLAIVALFINLSVYFYFQSNTPSSTKVLKGEKLERFFIVSKTLGPRYLIIENEAQFDQHFHPAALNGFNAIKPNFSKEWVIAIDDADTAIATEITIERCEIRQRSLRVVSQITRGAKQTYTMHPQSAIILPRFDKEIDQAIERIEFYDETGKAWANYIRRP
jgi:hypothetical protein